MTKNVLPVKVDMSNFYNVDLPVYDVYKEFNEMINSGKIKFPENNMKQICINTIDGDDDIHYGVGSLYRRYHDGKVIQYDVNRVKLEQDFTKLCSVFEGTVFEEIYNVLDEKYVLGRIRIIELDPRTCLSWHRDSHMRLHYPIKTNDGCMMIINDEIKRMKESEWCMANTCEWHTAINSGNESRIHIVTTIMGNKR